MADMLIKWLNDDVTLSKHITSIEKDFANGYFFGELFHKFEVQPDFRSFLNFNSSDCKQHNFQRWVVWRDVVTIILYCCCSKYLSGWRIHSRCWISKWGTEQPKRLWKKRRVQ